MEKLFRVLYFAGIVAEIIVRAPHERQRRQIPKTDQRITGVERGLLTVLFGTMFFIPLAYSLTPWLRFADYRWSPAAKARAGGIGALLLAASLWLFWRAHRDLGTNWSPTLEIGAQQTLVTKGVYRTIRHPMYASQFLWVLAQALLLPNWLAGLGGVLGLLPLYLVRVPREERMMLDHFGDDYRAYMAQTGRVVPKLHLSKEE
jgi:protein-S-isoprenylcysteine O-methyltransferase Ste14